MVAQRWFARSTANHDYREGERWTPSSRERNGIIFREEHTPYRCDLLASTFSILNETFDPMRPLNMKWALKPLHAGNPGSHGTSQDDASTEGRYSTQAMHQPGRISLATPWQDLPLS